MPARGIFNLIGSRSIAIVAMLLPGLWGGLLTATGAGGTARITEVQVGFSGEYKLGHWIPVWVTIRSGDEGFSGSIELSTIDSDNATTRFAVASSSPLKVEAAQQWEGWRYVKAGRSGGPIRVELRGEDGSLVAARTARDVTSHPSTWQWILTVGAEVGVEDAKAFLARMRAQPVLSSTLTDAGDFPTSWTGYEGVNVIVVPTGREDVLKTLSDRQFSALMRWLRLGGRLVLSASRRAETLFAPGHRFHAIRPGEFVKLDPYWKSSGLENFVQAAEPIRVSEDSRLAVFSEVRGRTLCFEGAGGTDDRSILTEYSVGFGTVTYVAVDLDLPPLQGWPARPRLLARLLYSGGADEESAFGDEGGSQVTHLGFDDLTGQLRAAMEQFPGVTLVQFSWVAGLIAVYILLTGPLDFFGLRRLHRPLLTWVTFPVAVILFCGLAVWLSHAWQGSRMQLNQVEVVDIDLEHQLARGTTWTRFYTPRATQLGIAVEPVIHWPSTAPGNRADRDAEVLLSWQGLPGTGLRGMNTPATPGMARDTYSVYYPLSAAGTASLGRIESLRIHPASTKGLVARWSLPVDFQSECQLTTDEFDLLEGIVANPLDIELSRCWVYYQNWAYPLQGSLDPGQSVRLRNAQPLDLKWQLTGRSVEGTAERRSPWQGDNVADMDRLAKMLMFHEAAGGKAYTGLTHRYQPFVDLSRHLRNGRAILVGRGEARGSRVTAKRTAGGEAAPVMAEDAQHHWTYYRIIMPVRDSEPEVEDGEPEGKEPLMSANEH